MKDNDVTEIKGNPEHPVNKGSICVKGKALQQLLNDENRLKYPMIKVDNEWKFVSWDEALGTVASKLLEVKERYGARALAFYGGNGLLGKRVSNNLWDRFCNVYGTPNNISSSDCFASKMLAHTATYGTLSSPTWAILGFRDDYRRNTRYMVVWGANPPMSHPAEAGILFELKRKGAKLIVVDPRKTTLAKKADIWAQIRPGTDGALALGIANVIIDKELHDKEFVSKYTVGFQDLSKRVQEYSPEKVEEITWVPAGTICEIAETYATNKPGFIIQGIATEHQIGGFQASRAMACLIGLTGNLDVPGGNIIVPTRAPLSDRSLIGMPLDGEPIGAKEFPLLVDKGRRGHSALLPKNINDGEIKAMIVCGRNLLLSAPETKVWKEALSKLEFIVVIDLYKAGLEEVADVFLPVASSLERTELYTYGEYDTEPYISLSEKVADRWGCWPDWKICCELARRMGYEEYFPWGGVSEVINELLKPTGLTIDDLKGKTGVPFGSMEYEKYKKGLKTPSGKFEFYSSLMKRYEYDPLPTHLEPAESPVSSPNIAKKYPLILTTGARDVNFLHTRFRSIPVLCEKSPDPLAMINPEVARKIGIHDGEWIIVESPRGEIEVRAKVTKGVHPKVVHVSHGWSPPSNVNELTSIKQLDPISGFPAFKSGLCRVRKIPS